MYGIWTWVPSITRERGSNGNPNRQTPWITRSFFEINENPSNSKRPSFQRWTLHLRILRMLPCPHLVFAVCSVNTLLSSFVFFSTSCILPTKSKLVLYCEQFCRSNTWLNQWQNIGLDGKSHYYFLWHRWLQVAAWKKKTRQSKCKLDGGSA